ncbi:MAG: hypothetical protein RL497_1470 [Pseudomonadota bacterium]|jgi:hypothetical protein
MLKCNKEMVAPMLNKYIRLTALTMAVIFNSSCEASMFTAKEDVVLFSRVQGKLFFEGKPVVSAKVIRRYIYDTKDPIEDFCITNNSGEFDFPSVVRKNTSVSGLTQFVSHQEMVVEFRGNVYPIWGHGKMEKAENSEYDGFFKKLKCNIDDELVRMRLNNRDLVLTNCVFEN